MTTRVSLQPAFVLHTRPFRDTSLLVDLLTYRHGRIAAVARGARQPRSRFKAALRAFDTILVSWSGDGDLVTVTQTERTGVMCDLQGRSLVCGLYLNELLLRTLTRYDPCPSVFNAYQKTIAALALKSDQQALRAFELHLLENIGYGINFTHDALTEELIVANAYYHFRPQQGFVAASATDGDDGLILGQDIHALARQTFDTDHQLQLAKRILRQAWAHVLGNRPLKSRELLLNNISKAVHDEPS